MIPKGTFGTKATLHITKVTPYLQWSMVVAALEIIFFSWNWGLNQGGGNYEQFQILVSVGTKPLTIC